jgi:hypothetical protein
MLSGGIKANVQTPSIIFAPPPINLSFPGFELPGNLYSPGGSGSTGTNIFNITPETTPPIGPPTGGIAQDPFPLTKGPIGGGIFDNIVPTDSIIPKMGDFDIFQTIGGLIFESGTGKEQLTEKTAYSVFTGGVSTIPKLTPGAAAAGVPAVPATGFALAKTGANIVNTASKATGPLAPIISDTKIGLGLTVGGLGLAIAGAGVAASGVALANQPNAASAIGFGASSAVVATQPAVLTAAGLPVFGAGLTGVAQFVPFLGAGVAGTVVGLEANKFLASMGFGDRPGILDWTGFINRGVPTTHGKLKVSDGSNDNSPLLPPSSVSDSQKSTSSSVSITKKSKSVKSNAPSNTIYTGSGLSAGEAAALYYGKTPTPSTNQAVL